MITDLKEFLDQKVDQYNRKEFIETDPISIPHKYTLKEDIEISAFITSTIAWGNRAAIIKNASKLFSRMGDSPYNFILNSDNEAFESFSDFKHRTFNGTDLICFFKAIQNIYLKHNGLEAVFSKGYSKDNTIKTALSYFRKVFFEHPHPSRTQKHIANVDKNTTAKRINMFLRWMVRKDNRGVDFGIWNKIPASDLCLPIDVHSGRVARKLNLLSRKQNDWFAVEEVMKSLRNFDPSDPVKYDFALFGLGVFEKF